MFSITDWNINPNQDWYITITDSGTEMTIKLFETQVNAVADTNIIAQVDAAFGQDVEIVLEEVTAGSISLFNSFLSYHLKVTGINGDSTKIFKINAFVDLPGIDNSIYRSELLIKQKAIIEINEHTHFSKIRSYENANHIPALKVGDILQIQSTKRGIDVLTSATEVVISGTQNTLVDQIESVEYIDFIPE